MDVKQAAGAYNAISALSVTPLPPVTTNTPSGEVQGSFMDMVSKSLNDAVDSGHKAEKISTLALMGKADINDLATAVSNAELALNTIVAISNKVVSAYQQIMQMPM